MIGKRRAINQEGAPQVIPTLSVDSVWPTNSQPAAEIIGWVMRALSGNTSPELEPLVASIHLAQTYHEPIATGSSDPLVWATWHHGSDYQTYWCGDVMTLLHYTATTDLEREAFILQSRKAISHGLIPYAVGVSITPSVPKKPQSGVEHMHLLCMKPSLY